MPEIIPYQRRLAIGKRDRVLFGKPFAVVCGQLLLNDFGCFNQFWFV